MGQPPPLEPHEVILREQQDVSITLKATDGSTIKASKCYLRLSNQYIVLSAAEGVTYRVQGKGDREFCSIKIPLVSAKPHRLVQPWFGPYKWETLISGPVEPPLEPQTLSWTLTITFASGGVFEYRQQFLAAFADASQAAADGVPEVLPAYEE